MFGVESLALLKGGIIMGRSENIAIFFISALIFGLGFVLGFYRLLLALATIWGAVCLCFGCLIRNKEGAARIFKIIFLMVGLLLMTPFVSFAISKIFG